MGAHVSSSCRTLSTKKRSYSTSQPRRRIRHAGVRQGSKSSRRGRNRAKRAAGVYYSGKRTRGDALVAFSFYIFYLVSKVNTYAAANVRVEDGQKVISTGVYGFVRHPIYFAALFLFVGTPLALGSWWTLLLFPLFIPILVARILNEEKVLVRDLPGYVEYTHFSKRQLCLCRINYDPTKIERMLTTLLPNSIKRGRKRANHIATELNQTWPQQGHTEVSKNCHRKPKEKPPAMFGEPGLMDGVSSLG